MFDPSKLDLDIDGKEENSNPKKQDDVQVIESESADTDTTETEQEQAADRVDVLADIPAPESSYSSKLQHVEENTTESVQKSEAKVVFDINITSLKDVANILAEKEYDFVTFEPDDVKVKLEFRKDKVIADTRYIKFPVYSNIVLKAKSIASLNLTETNKEQEGKGDIEVGKTPYHLLEKIVPGAFGEKMFLKLKKVDKKLAKKVKKKVSLSQIFSFLGAILLVMLIIGGGFLAFIVMNAENPSDVRFFTSLGINLNEINQFIRASVMAIFSIIVLFLTIFLAISLFKFILTKKEFRQKRVKYAIISGLLFVLTFAIGGGWMMLIRKIDSLPQWEIAIFGKVQVYDNSKLKSQKFDQANSIVRDTKSIIGPLEAKLDVSYLAADERKRGVDIQTFTWRFDYKGDIEEKETKEPILIKTFDKKGITNIELVLNYIEPNGNPNTKVITNIKPINISYIVDIKQKELENGSTKVEFDASDVTELGDIEWYDIEKNVKTPIHTGPSYIPIVAEEKAYGIYIRSSDKKSETIDRVFVVGDRTDKNLSGKINYKRGIVDDMEFVFSVTDIQNDRGSGFIETYKWLIDGKEYTTEGTVDDPEKSSEVKHIFKEPGDYEVRLIMTDSSGEEKRITQTVKIQQNFTLKKGIVIKKGNQELESVIRKEEQKEYYINNLGIPTELTFDARLVRPESYLYSLQKVEWDFNSDGDIDMTGRVGKYKFVTEGNHTVKALLSFQNKKVPPEIVVVEENIYIEAIKKDFDIGFKIITDSTYAPTVVSFDASSSTVKDANIEKFVWDFGDGTEPHTSGAAVIEGHRYVKEGDYNVRLTLLTEDGREFSAEKKLVIKPKPQSVKIKASLKRAPILQGIDFRSDDSDGDISSYFWDFGDGNNSTEANPTHEYSKPGTYKVELKIDFSNKNIKRDFVEIEVYED